MIFQTFQFHIKSQLKKTKNAFSQSELQFGGFATNCKLFVVNALLRKTSEEGNHIQRTLTKVKLKYD